MNRIKILNSNEVYYLKNNRSIINMKENILYFALFLLFTFFCTEYSSGGFSSILIISIFASIIFSCEKFIFNKKIILNEKEITKEFKVLERYQRKAIKDEFYNIFKKQGGISRYQVRKLIKKAKKTTLIEDVLDIIFD